MELLIGCGARRDKLLGKEEWTKLVTLDIAAIHKPDVVHDLERLPLPFADESFTEIHAYEVMEHVGQQGDWRFFFAQWDDFYRLLKPGGVFYGTSPRYDSVWAWGDPGHTRIISAECFTFLNQPAYVQIGQTPMTDYRFTYQGDFDAETQVMNGETLAYKLTAIKPARRVTNGH